jgi:hypothetical protein
MPGPLQIDIPNTGNSNQLFSAWNKLRVVSGLKSHHPYNEIRI